MIDARLSVLQAYGDLPRKFTVAEGRNDLYRAWDRYCSLVVVRQVPSAMTHPHVSTLTSAVAASALIVAGCIDPFAGPDFVTKRGLISDPVQLFHPDTLQVGTQGTVTVITHGNGCVRAGPTRLAVDDTRAIVEPYDSVRVGADVVCNDILREFTHTVGVVFAAPGTKTLRVIGRRLPDETEITIDREITVVP